MGRAKFITFFPHSLFLQYFKTLECCNTFKNKIQFQVKNILDGTCDFKGFYTYKQILQLSLTQRIEHMTYLIINCTL